MKDQQALEQHYGFEVYPKRDLTIVRGEGASLWDDGGREYIDCAAGVGVANVGHAHPAVARAVAEQAATLITCPGVFYNDVRGRLMQTLVELSPARLTRAFLCNSGTEANEAAIKFARHATGRQGFVCAMRGFHGRTLGALSATHKYREQYEPLLPGFGFVPFNNLDKLDRAVDDGTAAVVLEIVQGEGGVRPGKAEYFEGVRRICDERGALLIVDEVQTGFCRTGRMFACEHFEVQPDLLCLAKAMGGGVPIGAVLAADTVPPAVGMHGSTFGGNPLACAAALATIETMQAEDLAAAARAAGERFRAGLDVSRLSRVRELRQIGLMIGIELKEKSRPYLEALMEHGVLALPAGPTVIRLLPPLVITDEQIDTVLQALHAVLAD
jgi:acetylornithine/LysW-gamma-L-lysine aminotransferase